MALFLCRGRGICRVMETRPNDSAAVKNILNSSRHLHGIHQTAAGNALAIRPCNSEAASEPLLPKVSRCIPVLSSRYIGKCAACVLKRSKGTDDVVPVKKGPQLK